MAGETFYDLSHPIEDGMVTYPGLDAPIICDYLSREASRAHYEEGTEFHIGKMELVANTGTYIDAPFHRYEDGLDIADLQLRQMAELPGVCFDVRGIDAIETSHLDGISVEGKAVLFFTDWSRHWGSETYFKGHPYLTADTASLLVDKGATLVGIDSLNIDQTATGSRPVHSILLSQNIPIVEHLTGLHQLSGIKFCFSAVPAPVKGMGTFPVRAYARTC